MENLVVYIIEFFDCLLNLGVTMLTLSVHISRVSRIATMHLARFGVGVCVFIYFFFYFDVQLSKQSPKARVGYAVFVTGRNKSAIFSISEKCDK